jgi:hypothetical protein
MGLFQTNTTTPLYVWSEKIKMLAGMLASSSSVLLPSSPEKLPLIMRELMVLQTPQCTLQQRWSKLHLSN